MTVEDRRRELAALVAQRKEDEAYRWMVAQCNCGHTWNPIWTAADREKFPPGPISGWPAGSVVCPKCGSDKAGIVKPTFVE